MLKRMIAGGLVALAGLLAAPLALAEDLAVLVANEFYENYPRIRDGRSINRLEQNFADAGFEVVALRNLASVLPEQDAADLWARMAAADRLVVVLSGHWARSGDSNWLLMRDADRPSSFTLGAVGFPLDAVIDIAAAKQGASIVAVAVDGTPVDLGPGTSAYDFALSIPQGVTFIEGAHRDVADFISGEVLQPGRILAEARQAAPRGLRIEGYLPSNQTFLPRGVRRNNDAADRSDWQRAQGQDTLNAYENYLNRYPNGMFATEAAQRIQTLRVTPEDRARLAEDSLNLSRDQRRKIQRELELLGIEVGSIDGIFGGRTRQGISAWQNQNGITPTGYLNANQISQIASVAAVRAEELRAEAEQRRLETEQRDRQFWRQTGARGSEAGFRQYLERFPDGLFADEARASLAEFEREQRRQAQAAEREDWNRAVTRGTLQSYQTYLDQYPRGRFAEEARARVASLSRPETPPQVVEDAKREEDSLRLSGITRSLIEGQLDNLGMQPGAVDGRFDNNTRRALRRYQRANGLPATGYVTRTVIVRLLASAVQ